MVINSPKLVVARCREWDINRCKMAAANVAARKGSLLGAFQTKVVTFIGFP
jgi:hypothetical protein